MTPKDVTDIAAWGASVVLTLMPDDELGRLDLTELPTWIAVESMAWLHAPIQDFGAPDTKFLQAWPLLCQRLRARLDANERVLVHCRGGHGRSGTIVAALLIDAGLTAEDAITSTRRARPGAIETPGQEEWLRSLAAQGAGSG
ncbi:MAG: dual specificity protein phosphatase family protein [Alphaproteobacteria bacterium]|nr:dual specificity protein phosphatase family protein [Alphaproteobacteria bacterium]